MNNKTNSELEAIILGALLHDIGKFFRNAYPDENQLSSQSKGMERSICPKDTQTQRYTHKHVLWTNEFFEKFLSFSNNL